MNTETRRPEASAESPWPWRAGLVVSDPGLVAEIAAALAEVRAACVFQIAASAPVAQVFPLLERDRPDLLFVEFSSTPVPAAEWMSAVAGNAGAPLVVAVHVTAEPEQMICALRAGASEFLSLPMNPAIFGALERISARLQATGAAEPSKGRIVGIVSAKGGCGATTLACHLGLALAKSDPAAKILVADLDYQAAAVHRVCQVQPLKRAGQTFDSVRRLSSTNWAEFFTPLTGSVDMLAGPETGNTTLPEPWRIESLFRHLTRTYSLIVVDLGRHLNPGTWAFLQYVDELMVVAGPDVLALYQTRYIIQTLTSRGFERSRIRLILNKSETTPRDFWIQSIEQMFEMRLYGVIPTDRTALPGTGKDRFVFPSETLFGKAVLKLAARLMKDESPGHSRKAAA